MSEIDLRIARAGDIVESEGSLAARRFAETFGATEGSSYTSADDARPVAWAFAVDIGRGDRRLVIGGSEREPGRVLMFVPADRAFTGMLYAKALATDNSQAIERHVVTVVRKPAEASWLADSYYLSRHVLDGMGERDVLAVALHAGEQGLSADAVEPLVARRTPDWMSSPDPAASHAQFPRWNKLVRSLRRLARLRQLQAPEILLDKELAIARDTWGDGLAPELVCWPDDVRVVAAELGMS